MSKNAEVAQKIADLLGIGDHEPDSGPDPLVELLDRYYPPEQEGSWSWALARMKEGKRVMRRIWPNGYWLCFDSKLALVDEHGRVPLMMQTDFDATDWQLAEEN